jgi:hypothetical protein
MIADYLSSFYTMPCLLTVGGQPVQTTIRWYKAPKGAKILPFPSVFFSHINDADPGESVPGEPGEVGHPRTWDRGDNPGYQGQCWRGDPAWYASGALPTLNTIPASPCNCRIPPAVAAGGVVLGGAATPISCQQLTRSQAFVNGIRNDFINATPYSQFQPGVWYLPRPLGGGFSYVAWLWLGTSTSYNPSAVCYWSGSRLQQAPLTFSVPQITPDTPLAWLAPGQGHWHYNGVDPAQGPDLWIWS